MNLLDFNKEICANCKAKCKRGIVVTYYEDLTNIKCINYIPKGEFKGYTKPIKRTARQLEPIMKCMQKTRGDNNGTGRFNSYE